MTQRCGIWPSHGKMERIKEMDGWIKWVETHISEGYTAYLMTWMFQQLGDPDKFKSVESHEDHILRKMTSDMCIGYGRMRNRFDRKTKTIGRYDRNPKIIAFLDRAGSKRKKEKIDLDETLINYGLHYHGIVLTRYLTRKGRTLKQDIAEEQGYYLHSTDIVRIDCRRITEDIAGTVSYGFGAYRDGLFPQKYFLEFPKSISELPGREFRDHLRQVAYNR